MGREGHDDRAQGPEDPEGEQRPAPPDPVGEPGRGEAPQQIHQGDAHEERPHGVGADVGEADLQECLPQDCTVKEPRMKQKEPTETMSRARRCLRSSSP